MLAGVADRFVWEQRRGAKPLAVVQPEKEADDRTSQEGHREKKAYRVRVTRPMISMPITITNPMGCAVHSPPP